MEQLKPENEKQILRIHYYFKDKSHSMNAFVRNNMEKDLLNLISEISKTLDIDLKIESEAKEEGGLIDTFTLIAIGAMYFKSSVNQVVTYYLTGGFHKNKEMKLNNALKEQELERSKIQTKKEKLQLEEKQKLEANYKISRVLSNFYKKAENYEKIRKIGYRLEDNLDELIVERDKFKSFIIKENKDIEVVEEAEIAIISPVLKEGKYKWRGIYQEEKIDFSMGDSGFKIDVINQKYNFLNGTTIICQLEIYRTFDDYGDEIKTSYSVKKVYEIETNDVSQTTKLGIKRKNQKQRDQEPSLFDYIQSDNQGEIK